MLSKEMEMIQCFIGITNKGVVTDTTEILLWVAEKEQC